MRSPARQRRDEANLGLAGRALLEGLIAGAAMGPLVLLLMGLIAFALNPTLESSGGDVAVAVISVVYTAIFTAPVGVVGGVLALVALGVVAHRKQDTWTTSRAAWLVPALTIGVAAAGVGLLADWWAFSVAAVPAAALTAWRVRRAIASYVAATTAT